MRKILIIFAALSLLFLLWFDFLSGGITPTFPLDDKDAVYTIIANKGGEYSVMYRTDHVERVAFIGSTRIALDDFLERRVYISGAFRPILGSPLCLEVQCSHSSELQTPVIDVWNIEVSR